MREKAAPFYVGLHLAGAGKAAESPRYVYPWREKVRGALENPVP